MNVSLRDLNKSIAEVFLNLLDSHLDCPAFWRQLHILAILGHESG